MGLACELKSLVFFGLVGWIRTRLVGEFVFCMQRARLFLIVGVHCSTFLRRGSSTNTVGVVKCDVSGQLL
jgi:hypothetical protein